MHNKVVFATAEAFFGLSCKVLRFNFRGTGLSSGSHGYGKGEVEDVLAAVEFLYDQHPGLHCHVSGFSFGAWMAIEAAARETRLASLTAIAAPFRRFDPSLLSGLSIPKLFLQGTADELCPTTELQRLFPSFAEPKQMVLFEGAGHFFDSHLTDLKNAIATHKAFLGL
jgi:alpha/beta superfamily hydrolase